MIMSPIFPGLEDLSIAAFLHDAGKADTRFQTLLSGGDWWNLPDGPVMAKSGKPSPPGAWERADLPDGWRHEALSVRLAVAHPRFADAHDPGTRAVADRKPITDSDGRSSVSPIPLTMPRSPTCVAVSGSTRGSRGRGPGPQSLAFDFHGLDWATMFDPAQAALRDLGAGAAGDDSAPCRPPCVGTGAGAVSAAVSHRLNGLEADNLLAFLALLGVLRAIEEARPSWLPRVSWTVDSLPLRPVLHLTKAVSKREVVAAVASGLATLALRHEFTAGKDLKLSPADTTALLRKAARADHYTADLWAALVSDAAIRDKNKEQEAEPTPLCLLFGQGHQHFPRAVGFGSAGSDAPRQRQGALQNRSLGDRVSRRSAVLAVDAPRCHEVLSVGPV